MVRPLSMDLRERAVARIAAGESVRKVALALSVAPSSVVKWTQRLRATGSVAPGKIGGHVPPKIAGTHRAWLVARTAAAFTLRGLVPNLPGAGGRLSHRLDILPPRRPQLQKKTCWRASKTIPASPASAGGGRPARAALIRGGWSSSMKPGPRRIWGRCAGGLRAASACRDRFPTGTGRP